MVELLLANEPIVRMSAFLGVFGLMATLEVVMPRRRETIARRLRWPSNLGVVILDSLLLRMIFPVLAVEFALLGAEQGWGLFNALELPVWIALIASVMVLDLAIYLQHVVFHAVPVLWRLHRMHHADQAFDVTTALRFHPIEIVLSMLIKLGIIWLLGPPAIAVLLFEILLNGTAMFNHANVRIPLGVDRWLRLIIVTPDMHRVHHSVTSDETNSNFGFNLPWWDWLFATYRAQPAMTHETMTIGLAQFRDRGDLRLDRMLIQPFVAESDV